jgi:hypothetical protein
MPRLVRTFPESSRIRRGSYDPDKKVLDLEFRRDGARIEYLGVPASVWAGLLEAKSPGRYVGDALSRYRYIAK